MFINYYFHLKTAYYWFFSFLVSPHMNYWYFLTLWIRFFCPKKNNFLVLLYVCMCTSLWYELEDAHKNMIFVLTVWIMIVKVLCVFLFCRVLIIHKVLWYYIPNFWSDFLNPPMILIRIPILITYFLTKKKKKKHLLNRRYINSFHLISFKLLKTLKSQNSKD
jgi:hypothetical protein